MRGASFLILVSLLLMAGTSVCLADTAKEWYEKGQTLYNQGNYSGSINAFNKVIELDPNNSNAWSAKGAVLAKKKNYNEAIKAFEKVLELNPGDELTLFIEGGIYYRLGKNEAALRALNKALKLNPDYNDAENLKNEILASMKK